METGTGNLGTRVVMEENEETRDYDIIYISSESSRSVSSSSYIESPLLKKVKHQYSSSRSEHIIFILVSSLISDPRLIVLCIQ